ncbi:MAG: PepSY-associated TM helix domain-containing protein [Asticcacaulis sp.]|uniref:PepSY domain-containing protein n=1 Tax=Asticcacaulis sp. TaxID=1872648 RepID=UPI0039E67917
MKGLHRLLGIVAALVLLYLGATGSLIQMLDLRAMLGHAPEDDPTLLSLNGGRYGGPDYQVLAAVDFKAQALPDGLDVDQALATVMQAFGKSESRFVELRMSGNRPVGQIGIGEKVLAFDAVTGAPVAEVDIDPPADVSSLRESTKQWHRFWSRPNAWGVWLELACGLILWAMIISGLAIYFRLLKTRTAQGTRHGFWRTDGTLHALHRSVATVAAIFLVFQAASGTWLAFESVWHNFSNFRHGDVASPVNLLDAPHLAEVTLKAFREAEPQTPIKVIRLRTYAGMKQGVVIAGRLPTRQFVYNAETGQPAGLSEPGYPSSGFPFGTAVHEAVKHFHSGHMFGLPTSLMNLFAGLSLIFLSISGGFLYLHREENGAMQ